MKTGKGSSGYRKVPPGYVSHLELWRRLISLGGGQSPHTRTTDPRSAHLGFLSRDCALGAGRDVIRRDFTPQVKVGTD